MPVNKNKVAQSVSEMKSKLQQQRAAERNIKKEKPRQDIGDENPMLRLRYAIKPTPEEIAARSPRDKRKKFLLQRELATRVPCCSTTIRYAEKHKRFPLQRGVYESALKLYNQYFPPPPPAPRAHAFIETPEARRDLDKRIKKKPKKKPSP